ncbi:hypothetical protein HELRODRAFT_63257 [Helobdella robusta]|uniref:RING-type domain-containing protein n=1 Tax=Helobdella robusta TaxID=6412 RepID=T1FXD0_HELRO|nr:hypothetical protein HELRODRAFT_63257 [Helobdella robusta]ESO12434.1 hypothetical protein HELRODRAFT_63257 [Helobdella robusta]
MFPNIKYFRCFINPESVSPHLFCSICQEVFVEPYRAPCGHSYCKHCIMEWLKNSNTCPEDRKKLTLKNMHHDFILENIIGDQKVGCPYREQGCCKVLNLSALGLHLKDCSFNPLNIPEFLKKDLHSLSPKDAGNFFYSIEV